MDANGGISLRRNKPQARNEEIEATARAVYRYFRHDDLRGARLGLIRRLGVALGETQAAKDCIPNDRRF